MEMLTLKMTIWEGISAVPQTALVGLMVKAMKNFTHSPAEYQQSKVRKVELCESLPLQRKLNSMALV